MTADDLDETETVLFEPTLVTDRSKQARGVMKKVLVVMNQVLFQRSQV